jgi:hypothetical protein
MRLHKLLEDLVRRVASIEDHQVPGIDRRKHPQQMFSFSDSETTIYFIVHGRASENVHERAHEHLWAVRTFGDAECILRGCP